MLDEKKINELKRRVIRFIKEGIITREKEKLFTEFFLKNAKDSLDSSKLLFEVSTNNKLKQETGFSDFNGFFMGYKFKLLFNVLYGERIA